MKRHVITKMILFHLIIILLSVNEKSLAQINKRIDLITETELRASIIFHQLLNEYRLSKGCDTIRYNNYLWQTCRNHNRWMIENNNLSHTENKRTKNFTGTNPGARLKYISKDKCDWSGENCLYNYSYSENNSIEENAYNIAMESLNQWKTSSGHNKNMLGAHYSEATAFSISNKGIVWATSLFGMCDE